MARTPCRGPQDRGSKGLAISKRFRHTGPQRVAVIGTSCAGKTTFARELAKILACKEIDLDPLTLGTELDAQTDRCVSATLG